MMDWESVPRPRAIRYILAHVYRSIAENRRLYKCWLELLPGYITSSGVLDRVVLDREVLGKVRRKPAPSRTASHLDQQPPLAKKPCLEPAHLELLHFESSHLEPSHLEPLLEPTRLEPLRLELEPTRLEPTHLEPTRLEPSRLEPSHPQQIICQAVDTTGGEDPENQCSNEHPPPPKKMHLEPPSLEIVRQPCDTVVSEGKSTLLEVQVVASRDADISYQWLKDGYRLKDGHLNILCIYNAGLASKGTYSCEISLSGANSKLVCCEPIALGVRLSATVEVLVDRYLAEPEVPVDSWPPVNNMYINLALIKQGRIDKAGQYGLNTVQGDVDDVIANKESIEYETVFTNLENATRLLIEGRPGSGKTTLVHKFTQDWARGHPLLDLHNIKLLFLVHLRGFFNRGNISLHDIVQLYYTEESMVDSVTRRVKDSDGKGVCFILDGLDEYCPKVMRQAFIYKLITRRNLPMAVVIVASRPAASCQFRRSASKQVEVIGFLKQQIFEYIEKYPFSVPDKGKDLRVYLEHYPNVRHMCYLPVHTAMVCYLFDVMLPRTETEVYTEFTTQTLLRTLKRDEEDRVKNLRSFDDLPQPEKETFLKICKLGFEKTASCKQVMKEDEVKGICRGISCGNESMGLITVDCMAVKSGFEDLYTFLHLTFQEYLAAYYLFKQDKPDQLSILKEHGKKQHMQVVLKFFCGLAGVQEEDIKFEEIMKSTQCRVKMDSLCAVQCAFEYQKQTACDYVVQFGTLCFQDLFLTPSDLTAIGYVMKNSTHPVEKLVLDRCRLSREGLNSFFEEAGEKTLSVKTLCFHGRDCKMEQYKLVNSCLKNMPSIEILDLSDTYLGSRKVEVLTRGVSLPNLHTVTLPFLNHRHLMFNSRTIKQVLWDGKHVKSACKHISSVHLYLHRMSRPPRVVLKHQQLLIADVKLVSENLMELAWCTSLDLARCGIGDEGCQILVDGLVHCTTLRALALSKNKIGDPGAVELSKVFKPCAQLQSLDIRGNLFGAIGMTAIAENIKQCTLLQTLNLSHNGVGDIGATSLAQSLQHLTCIKVLDLSFTNIGDHGATSLAEVFEDLSAGSNSSFQKLALSYNHIGNLGALSLARNLQHLNYLTELDISCNKIGDEGATAIARAVSCIKGLKFRVWNHRISKDGSSDIASLIPDADRNFDRLTISSAMLVCKMTATLSGKLN